MMTGDVTSGRCTETMKNGLSVNTDQYGLGIVEASWTHDVPSHFHAIASRSNLARRSKYQYNASPSILRRFYILCSRRLNVKPPRGTIDHMLVELFSEGKDNKRASVILQTSENLHKHALPAP